MPPRIEVPVNRTQLGRLVAVSQRLLTNLVTAGVIQPVIPGKGHRAATFDAMQAVPAILKRERAQSRSGEMARARKDESQAKLNELKLRREEGRLVVAEDVERRARDVVLTCRTILLGLPHRVIVSRAAPPSAEPVLTRIVHDVLTELARLPDTATDGPLRAPVEEAVR